MFDTLMALLIFNLGTIIIDTKYRVVGWVKRSATQQI